MVSENNIKQIVKLLGVKDKESILLLSDSTTQNIVVPLENILKDTNDVNHVNLDNYQRPLQNIPEDIEGIAKGVDLCFYAIEDFANGKIREVTFRMKLVNLVEKNNGRVGLMISPNEELIESAFAYDTEKIRDLTEKIRDYMQTVKLVKVTSKEGTDAIFEFDPKNEWIASTGFIKKGKSRNAIGAEVFTYPIHVEGTIKITGSYAQLTPLDQFKNFKKTSERMKKNPIIWKIKDDLIKEVTCGDKEIESIVRGQIFGIKNANRIGEYGMGTNIGIKECIGNVMLDEKYPGVHLANGVGLPVTGANYKCEVHYDGILLHPTVINLFNKKEIMKNGMYCL